jgi:hypothetical protein
MASDGTAPRSRRALLAAAAGAAGALAAQAALPLAAAAAPANLQTESDNATTAPTSVTNSADGSTAFAGHATGTGAGYGLEGTGAGGAGVFAWSVQPPTDYWTEPPFEPGFTSHTGVFGSAPQGDLVDTFGVGVWGDSPNIGVYGTGSAGVYGFGFVGVEGDANSLPGSVGVWAFAPSTATTALKVTGKVSLSRSGRQSVSSGKSSYAKTVAGVTTSSKVFAVLATSESGRYIRAVVPGSGKFTGYFNTALSSSAVFAWFVLD